jgi:hypothetical protein
MKGMVVKLLTIISVVIFLISCREKINEVEISEELITPVSTVSKIILPEKWSIWRQDTKQNITWHSNFDYNSVKIELIKKGVVKYTIAQDTENDGIFTWSIPNDIINSNMYTIKISRVSNLDSYFSSEEFSIRNF